MSSNYTDCCPAGIFGATREQAWTQINQRNSIPLMHSKYSCYFNVFCYNCWNCLQYKVTCDPRIRAGIYFFLSNMMESDAYLEYCGLHPQAEFPDGKGSLDLPQVMIFGNMIFQLIKPIFCKSWPKEWFSIPADCGMFGFNSNEQCRDGSVTGYCQLFSFYLRCCIFVKAG